MAKGKGTTQISRALGLKERVRAQCLREFPGWTKKYEDSVGRMMRPPRVPEEEREARSILDELTILSERAQVLLAEHGAKSGDVFWICRPALDTLRGQRLPVVDRTFWGEGPERADRARLANALNLLASVHDALPPTPRVAALHSLLLGNWPAEGDKVDATESSVINAEAKTMREALRLLRTRARVTENTP